MSEFWFLLVGLALGSVIGAVPLRRYLDKPAKPRTAVPLSNVVSMSEWRKLDLPPAKRRQAIRRIP